MGTVSLRQNVSDSFCIVSVSLGKPRGIACVNGNWREMSGKNELRLDYTTVLLDF